MTDLGPTDCPKLQLDSAAAPTQRFLSNMSVPSESSVRGAARPGSTFSRGETAIVAAATLSESICFSLSSSDHLSDKSSDISSAESDSETAAHSSSSSSSTRTALSTHERKLPAVPTGAQRCGGRVAPSSDESCSDQDVPQASRGFQGCPTAECRCCNHFITSVESDNAPHPGAVLSRRVISGTTCANASSMWPSSSKAVHCTKKSCTGTGESVCLPSSPSPDRMLPRTPGSTAATGVRERVPRAKHPPVPLHVCPAASPLTFHRSGAFRALQSGSLVDGYAGSSARERKGPSELREHSMIPANYCPSNHEPETAQDFATRDGIATPPCTIEASGSLDDIVPSSRGRWGNHNDPGPSTVLFGRTPSPRTCTTETSNLWCSIVVHNGRTCAGGAETGHSRRACISADGASPYSAKSELSVGGMSAERPNDFTSQFAPHSNENYDGHQCGPSGVASASWSGRSCAEQSGSRSSSMSSQEPRCHSISGDSERKAESRDVSPLSTRVDSYQTDSATARAVSPLGDAWKTSTGEAIMCRLLILDAVHLAASRARHRDAQAPIDLAPCAVSIIKVEANRSITVAQFPAPEAGTIVALEYYYCLADRRGRRPVEVSRCRAASLRVVSRIFLPARLFRAVSRAALSIPPALETHLGPICVAWGRSFASLSIPLCFCLPTELPPTREQEVERHLLRVARQVRKLPPEDTATSCVALFTVATCCPSSIYQGHGQLAPGIDTAGLDAAAPYDADTRTSGSAASRCARVTLLAPPLRSCDRTCRATARGFDAQLPAYEYLRGNSISRAARPVVLEPPADGVELSGSGTIPVLAAPPCGPSCDTHHAPHSPEPLLFRPACCCNGHREMDQCYPCACWSLPHPLCRVDTPSSSAVAASALLQPVASLEPTPHNADLWNCPLGSCFSRSCTAACVEPRALHPALQEYHQRLQFPAESGERAALEGASPTSSAIDDLPTRSTVTPLDARNNRHRFINRCCSSTPAAHSAPADWGSITRSAGSGASEQAVAPSTVAYGTSSSRNSSSPGQMISPLTQFLAPSREGDSNSAMSQKGSSASSSSPLLSVSPAPEAPSSFANDSATPRRLSSRRAGCGRRDTGRGMAMTRSVARFSTRSAAAVTLPTRGVWPLRGRRTDAAVASAPPAWFRGASWRNTPPIARRGVLPLQRAAHSRSRLPMVPGPQDHSSARTPRARVPSLPFRAPKCSYGPTGPRNCDIQYRDWGPRPTAVNNITTFPKDFSGEGDDEFSESSDVGLKAPVRAFLRPGVVTHASSLFNRASARRDDQRNGHPSAVRVFFDQPVPRGAKTGSGMESVRESAFDRVLEQQCGTFSSRKRRTSSARKLPKAPRAASSHYPTPRRRPFIQVPLGCYPIEFRPRIDSDTRSDNRPALLSRCAAGRQRRPDASSYSEDSNGDGPRSKIALSPCSHLFLIVPSSGLTTRFSRSCPIRSKFRVRGRELALAAAAAHGTWCQSLQGFHEFCSVAAMPTAPCPMRRRRPVVHKDSVTGTRRPFRNDKALFSKEGDPVPRRLVRSGKQGHGLKQRDMTELTQSITDLQMSTTNWGGPAVVLHVVPPEIPSLSPAVPAHYSTTTSSRAEHCESSRVSLVRAAGSDRSNPCSTDLVTLQDSIASWLDAFLTSTVPRNTLLGSGVAEPISKPMRGRLWSRDPIGDARLVLPRPAWALPRPAVRGVWKRAAATTKESVLSSKATIGNLRTKKGLSNCCEGKVGLCDQRRWLPKLPIILRLRQRKQDHYQKPAQTIATGAQRGRLLTREREITTTDTVNGAEMFPDHTVAPVTDSYEQSGPIRNSVGKVAGFPSGVPSGDEANEEYPYNNSVSSLIGIALRHLALLGRVTKMAATVGGSPPGIALRVARTICIRLRKTTPLVYCSVAVSHVRHGLRPLIAILAVPDTEAEFWGPDDVV